MVNCESNGLMFEWLMGVDCKFVGYVYVGLNLVWFIFFVFVV